MAAGCATHQTAKLEAAHALNQPAVAAAEPQAVGAGMASEAWGDRWTAANLYEQAVDGYPSPMNRFNLANAYERTGRVDLARQLYVGLLRDGQYTWLRGTPDYRQPEARVVRFNVADESARRLGLINAMASRAPMPAGAGALSAGEAATQVSATVGGPANGRISDAEAQRRDAMAEAAGG